MTALTFALGVEGACGLGLGLGLGEGVGVGEGECERDEAAVCDWAA